MQETRPRCRHLVASEEAYSTPAITLDYEKPKLTPIEVLLCEWADAHPEKMMDVPRWVQRNVLSGHLWREGDCAGCPAYDPPAQVPTGT